MVAFKTPRAVMAALMGIPVLAFQANAAVLFQDTFEAGYLDSRWSGASRIGSDAAIFTHFNGRQNNSYVQLNLSAVPPPAAQIDSPTNGGGSSGTGAGSVYWQYTLTFDFYAFDSWDGSVTTYGPDYFRVSVNNDVLFNHTFSNQPGCPQTFREPDIGRYNMGGSTAAWDSIYRDISIPFTVASGSTIAIRWADGGLQTMTDESWAIDNVRVTYALVPGPASSALLAGAGLLGTRRRRAAN